MAGQAHHDLVRLILIDPFDLPLDEHGFGLRQDLLGDVRVGQHHELISTRAKDALMFTVRPGRFEDCRTDLPNHCVPGGLPLQLVDHAEVIGVKEHDFPRIARQVRVIPPSERLLQRFLVKDFRHERVPFLLQLVGAHFGLELLKAGEKLWGEPDGKAFAAGELAREDHHRRRLGLVAAPHRLQPQLQREGEDRPNERPDQPNLRRVCQDADADPRKDADADRHRRLQPRRQSHLDPTQVRPAARRACLPRRCLVTRLLRRRQGVGRRFWNRDHLNPAIRITTNPHPPGSARPRFNCLEPRRCSSVRVCQARHRLVPSAAIQRQQGGGRLRTG